MLWNRPIGKVSLLVQLDYKDWLHKANTSPDIDKRIAYLEKALQDNGSNILLKTQLAGLYFDIKRYQDAAQLYKEIDQSGKSRNISEKLLLVYQMMNKTDEALQVYLDLLKLTEEQQTFSEFLSYLKKKKTSDQAEKFLERHEQEIPAFLPLPGPGGNRPTGRRRQGLAKGGLSMGKGRKGGRNGLQCPV